MQSKKVVVAHPYQQHSFQTASAVKKNGYLYKYITTVYDKQKSFTSCVKKILKGDNLKRADRRKCDYLDEKEVIQYCELESLLLLLLYRIDKSKFFYNKLNQYILKKYNRKLAEFLMKNDVDAVILYDTVCAECIRILKKHKSNIKIIIDMSAPNFVYMDYWYEQNIKMYPKQSRKLIDEISSVNYKKMKEKATYEIANADGFLVASEFSRQSLIFSGIDSEKIFVCRYGIDVEGTEIQKKNEKRIHIGFIGNVTQKKGIIDFLRVVDLLDETKFEFSVVGAVDKEDEIYRNNKGKCNFVGYVTHETVLEICNTLDVLIFPSLSDGFGLSVIEAMSRKTVPIVSINAGVSDVIVDQSNGYVFTPGDVDSIVDICIRLEQDRVLLKDKQKEAYKSVCNLKWDDYYKEVFGALKVLINE